MLAARSANGLWPFLTPFMRGNDSYLAAPVLYLDALREYRKISLLHCPSPFLYGFHQARQYFDSW